MKHDFVTAGLKYDEVLSAVDRAIGRLEGLVPGANRGAIDVNGVRIRYNAFLQETGEISVNFWIQ
jgi:hypothetical protein